MILIGEIFLKREEVGYLFKMLFGFFLIPERWSVLGDIILKIHCRLYGL